MSNLGATLGKLREAKVSYSNERKILEAALINVLTGRGDYLDCGNLERQLKM